MGENESWHEPGELSPNGLLPGAGPVMQALDRERWSRAEGRTAELLACIKPNTLAEVRRNAVADYVRRLIMKCFPCQVFTFGSVPLKTYLPDGDIDLTAFTPDQNMKDTWAKLVCEMLESEEKNGNAEFHVKEVQYIQAEVKIIKCLVENIVVDISFNQVGGLCTLCFLEEVDNLISQNYLFKQSIILVKAWCYYESRILGAHHGLISTYALETLVLYIFNVFNNSFQGPLEVLYCFLEFFSKFDWDNFCVSLRGPVPISSLPDVAVDPPRKDNGELLLSNSFLEACSSVYAVFPGQENDGQPFISKHFNVIDPLRVNNNLGRSVSKGNFFRIRSAFAFGAKRLARLLDCPSENLISEINLFFSNTWERHGSGRRPDTAGGDILRKRLSTLDVRHDFVNSSDIGGNNVNENSVVREKEDGGFHGHGVSSQHGGISAKMMPMTSELSAASHIENLKSQNLKTLWVADQMGSENVSARVLHSPGIQTDSKAVHLVNDTQGRFLFARTHSSPELTDVYGDVSSQSWRNRQTEASYANGSSAKMNTNSGKQNHGFESLGRFINHSSVEEASSRSLDAAANDSNCILSSCHKDLGSGPFSVEFSSNSEALVTAHQENPENQDIVTMMASASLQGFDGPFHIPLNLNSAHIPFSIQPSFLASMGYTHWNMSGFGPTNIPLINQPYPNVQFPPGLVSQQLIPCFHGFVVDLPSENSLEQSNEKFDSIAKNSEEVSNDFQKDQDACSSSGCDPEKGNFGGLQSGIRPPALMPGSKYVPPPQASTSANSMRAHQKLTREKHGSVRQSIENFPIPEDRSASSRFSSAMHQSSLRSKTSWDGSSTKSSTEKRGKKIASGDQAASHGKGKIMSEPMLNLTEDNEQKCVILPNMGTEMMIERQPEPESVSFQAPKHQMPGLEAVQTNGMDSMIPSTSMLIDPGPRQRINENSGLVPFYPAGPPIPFLTMLYNVPSERGNSDLSSGDYGGDATLKNSESIHGPLEYNYSENLNPSNSLRESSAAKTSERKTPDTLHSDFASHWQNLQFARFCQDPQHHGPLLHPSPVMVPHAYLQCRFPYDNPGRLLLTNANIFSQLMTGYGHRLAPVVPLQSVSGRPLNMYQHHADVMGRSHSGTGTYLPNPVSVMERHSTGARRGNYNHDWNGDREGN